MALRFFTGLDAQASLLSGLFDSQGTGGGGAAPSLDSGTGRTGNALLQSRSNGWAEKVLTAQSTWIVGFAFKPNLALAAGMFSLLDGATTHVALVMNSSRQLEVRRASGTGTVLATSVTLIPLAAWTYIELKILISDTVGTIDMVINGTTETLTFASGSNGSQDTRNGGNATADRFRMGDASVALNNFSDLYDDIYVCDGTGGAPTNTFLGDVRCEALFPSGNGNTSNLVGNDGNSTDNYLLVDETSPNSDTDYVESATVGDKDTYAFTNLTPTVGTVYGVVIAPFQRKSDAGTRKTCSIARLSGTEEDSADKTMSNTYIYQPDIRETKPGGGAWTISDVNSTEFGVKVTV